MLDVVYTGIVLLAAMNVVVAVGLTMFIIHVKVCIGRGKTMWTDGHLLYTDVLEVRQCESEAMTFTVIWVLLWILSHVWGLNPSAAYIGLFSCLLVLYFVYVSAKRLESRLIRS